MLICGMSLTWTRSAKPTSTWPWTRSATLRSTIGKPINETYGLNIHVVNPDVDPTFQFATVDHDGKIRMDCSSPYAMARLVSLRIGIASPSPTIQIQIATASMSPDAGLMNPNHYLAVAIRYLLIHRPLAGQAAVGKTLVSSSMIDRVVQKLRAV